MSAQVTITQLPAAGTITGSESVPIVQNGQTVRTTTGAIASAPSQTQTFITLVQETTLPNSRYLGAINGLTLSASSPQGVLNISPTGALLSLVNAGTGIQAKTDSTTVVGRTITGTANSIDVANGNGVSGNPTLAISANPTLPGSAGAVLPTGTTAQRPSGTNGTIRYNSETGLIEAYQNGVWTIFAASPGLSSVGTGTGLTGGPITTTGTISIANTTVTAGSYTNANITVNAQGQITAAANGTPAGVTSFSGGTTGLLPNTPTTGAIALSGTLAVANGGSGVTVSSGANSIVLRDASSNITANANFSGFTSVAASGTLITLTAASTPSYLVTGSGGQVIKLPDATTLPAGAVFSFNNAQSSGAITVSNASSTLVVSVLAGEYTTVILTSNSTAAGVWERHDVTPSSVSWSTTALDYSGSITSAVWNGVIIATNRGGTGTAYGVTGGTF